MDHNIALTELGMISDSQPSNAHDPRERDQTEHSDRPDQTNQGATIVHLAQHAASVDEQADHFVQDGDLCYAGSHLIVDLWGAERLDDLDHIEATLREAVDAAGATLLHIHLHHFTPNGGVSGVAVLAESHISIHTWPERDYAALDVFMCGDAQPKRTLPILKRAFSPSSVQIGDFKRGVVG
jgi:S-adenosylmethionine decarboxylase